MSEELKSKFEALIENSFFNINGPNTTEETMLILKAAYDMAKADEWVSVEIPPKESGRYWCYVKEINDLGVSYFQWNCSYDVIDNTWSDNLKLMTVTHWTNLLPNPQINKEK